MVTKHRVEHVKQGEDRDHQMVTRVNDDVGHDNDIRLREGGPEWNDAEELLENLKLFKGGEILEENENIVTCESIDKNEGMPPMLSENIPPGEICHNAPHEICTVSEQTLVLHDHTHIRDTCVAENVAENSDAREIVNDNDAVITKGMNPPLVCVIYVQFVNLERNFPHHMMNKLSSLCKNTLSVIRYFLT